MQICQTLFSEQPADTRVESFQAYLKYTTAVPRSHLLLNVMKGMDKMAILMNSL